MDLPALPPASAEPAETADLSGAAHAVLARIELDWASGQHTSAVLLHAARTMLVLEASDANHVLPPLGTAVKIKGAVEARAGRLAEHGRAGRFLIALGERDVRRSLRLRVSLPAIMRHPGNAEPKRVEIVDLTTGGARIRGVELAVGAPVTLDFTPPGRTDQVTVRAVVAHGTHGATQPWVGVTFRLVAMRGGR